MFTVWILLLIGTVRLEIRLNECDFENRVKSGSYFFGDSDF